MKKRLLVFILALSSLLLLATIWAWVTHRDQLTELSYGTFSNTYVCCIRPFGIWLAWVSYESSGPIGELKFESQPDGANFEPPKLAKFYWGRYSQPAGGMRITSFSRTGF